MNGEAVEMPNVMGRDFAEAREMLQDLGLSVIRSNAEQHDPDQGEGYVVDQDPKPGKVASESLVPLIVNPPAPRPE